VIDPIFVSDIDSVPQTLRGVLADGDVVLTLGAGSIGALANSLPEEFAARDVSHA